MLGDGLILMLCSHMHAWMLLFPLPQDKSFDVSLLSPSIAFGPKIIMQNLLAVLWDILNSISSMMVCLQHSKALKVMTNRVASRRRFVGW